MSVQPHDFVTTPSMTDPPFAVPPDHLAIDLPAPPSVNRTRKVDWAARGVLRQWGNVADAYMLAARIRTREPLKRGPISRFELLVILDEQQNRIDLDNGLKCVIDYLVRIEVLEDDGKQHMRRLTVEWGKAPFGCRVIVRPCT